MPVSIVGGLTSLAVGAVGVFRQGGPRPYLFAWSALFLSLGWNFFEYGFDAPGGGTSAGWIVCGVVFAVMGGVPLVLLLSPAGARLALWGPRIDADEGPVTTSPRIRRAIPIGPLPRPTAAPTPGTRWPPGSPGAPGPPAATPASPAARSARPGASPAPSARSAPSTTPAVSEAPEADLVDRLARLADLHERGALDDDEYERAKDAVLGGRTAP
jgi:hypothetical protein